jgi:hypothetical protein
MQNGVNSNGEQRSEAHVLRTSGDLGTCDHVAGTKDGGGTRSALVWSSAAGQRRSHRCSGSVGDRSSDIRGVNSDTPGTTKEPGVDSLAGAGARGSVPGLQAGPGLASYANSGSSRERGPHRRGQADLSPVCTEARARAMFAHHTREGGRGSASSGDSLQGHQAVGGHGPHLDSPAPQRNLPAQHEAARQEQPSRNPRQRQPKPRMRGRVPRDGRPRSRLRRQGPRDPRRGGQRWHQRRRPSYFSTQAEARRHLHAGRTPGPGWRRGGRHSARR